MSTLKATNIKNESSASNNIVLDSGGGVVVSGILTATTFSGNVSGDITIGAGSTSAPSLAPSGDSNTGIFFPAADTIAFGEGGTESARFDSSGRLGIGTANPGSTLHVFKSGDGQTPVRFQTGNANGNLYFYNDSNGWSLDSDGDIRFVTSRTSSGAPQRVTITSNGYLRIDPNASNECRLEFQGSGARMSYDTGTGHISFITNSAVRNLFLYNGQGTEFRSQSAIFPTTDNAVTCGTGGNRWSAVYAANGTIQTSDSRQKCEIQQSILGTDFIKSLKPVSYRWIEGGKSPIVKDVDENGNTYVTDENGDWVYESKIGQRTHWGFIAQEVKEVVDAAGVDFGGWVLTDKDDPDSEQALRYDQFIAPLTKALQEAIAEIESLKAQNAAILARLDAAGI